MRFWRGRNKTSDNNVARETLELYYASDIHGSDLLWRKFLGASRFYAADALVMGGDLVGKAVVPIEHLERAGYRTRFLGEEQNAGSPEELARLITSIRFNGFYAWVASAEEIAARTSNAEAQSELFDEIIKEDLTKWVTVAEGRIDRTTPVFVMAGNDDPWFIDEILSTSQGLVFCDDKIVRVGDYEMLSLSYSNQTPWNSPRELSEDELYKRIKRLADQLENPKRAIFNLHVPPYASGLDRARKIGDDLAVVYESGQPVEVPVGSTAVRQIIEQYQPLLSLHGHIHECRGETYIGRTLAINSGSEYNTGRLHGVTITLCGESVAKHQFVAG